MTAQICLSGGPGAALGAWHTSGVVDHGLNRRLECFEVFETDQLRHVILLVKSCVDAFFGRSDSGHRLVGW